MRPGLRRLRNERTDRREGRRDRLADVDDPLARFDARRSLARLRHEKAQLIHVADQKLFQRMHALLRRDCAPAPTLSR